jgi:hypothetical protein
MGGVGYLSFEIQVKRSRFSTNIIFDVEINVEPLSIWHFKDDIRAL